MHKLLSFLGTRDYTPVYYTLNGKRSSKTSFFQRALLEFMRDDSPDEVIIFLTDQARKQNWKKLKEELEELGVKSKGVQISGIGREEELWKDFGRILECLDNGDEIDFDITYSFRYQPIMAMLVIHFASVVKDVQIRGIYYGNFEEKVGDEAPVLNLRNFVDMQEWITNVYAFVESGRAESLSKWVEEKKGLMSQSSLSPRVEAAEELVKKWNQLAENLQTCRGPKISRSAKEAQIALQQVRKEEPYPTFVPLYALFDDLENQLEKMAIGDDIEANLETVQWCIDHGLIQQAYTLLTEVVITAFCWAEGRNPIKKKKRGEITWHINKAIEVLKGQKSFDCFTPKQQDVIRRMLKHSELLIAYQRIADLRHDINHAGWRENSKEAGIFLKGLKENYLIIVNYIRQLRQEVKQV